jgi:mono/diheme cytochrome c family protein
LNSMGSYANQLNREERWMVSHYVMQLKSKL